MIHELARMLDPAPMAIETGWRRHDSGVLEIAARTDLHGCTGAMFEWWFRSRPQTREYRWWHPIDHLTSSWEEWDAQQAADGPAGTTHLVEEKLTNLPAQKLFIQFRDPAEAVGEEPLAAARADGAVSAIVYAHAAPQEVATYDPDGALLGTRMAHVCRDTAWGAALRSRFLFGYDLVGAGLSPDEIVALVPDIVGPDLLQHCYDEFTFLSRILPGIYDAEHRDPETIEHPW